MTVGDGCPRESIGCLREGDSSSVAEIREAAGALLGVTDARLGPRAAGSQMSSCAKAYGCRCVFCEPEQTSAESFEFDGAPPLGIVK